MLEIWEVFQTTEFFNRRLLEEEMCYENKYEPFDLYLLSEQQEKNLLLPIFMSYFPGFSFISMPKTALVEKCDKTGPNWLGNGQKRGEKCQCLFYTVVKMAICPSVGEKKRWNVL